MGFLRVLLALIVLVHHIPQIPGNHSFPFLMGYLDAMVAVLIFYIFSGFYMSLVINRKYSKAPHFPISFYANRALRIFPLYWLMLLLVFIYYSAGRHADRIAGINSQPWPMWFAQVFMNITTLGLDLVPSLGGYTQQLIGPAWSLGSEWLFYLLAPWLVRFSWRRTAVLISVVFAIRLYLYHLGVDRYPFRVLFFPLSLGFFMLGHLAYLGMTRFELSSWMKRHADKSRTGVIAIVILLASGFVLHMGKSIDPETPALWAFYLLVTLFIPILFITLRQNRIDKFLGDLTFPLYISHALVLTFVADFITSGENAQRVIAVVLSLLFAVLLTISVEMPVERIRAAFGAWVMRPDHVYPPWMMGSRPSDGPVRPPVQDEVPPAPAPSPRTANIVPDSPTAGNLHSQADRRLAFAILLVPVFLMFLWHLCNHRLPSDDGANFAQTAAEITAQAHQGVLQGVIALFDHRGWRPTAFPPLGVPFLLMTGDDVVAACAALQFFLYAALAFYLYALARQCAASRLVAAAAATSVISLPGIADYFHVFYSESAWVLFSVACAYHLLRSGPFRRTSQALAAGIFGGLMVTVRPAESFVVLLVLIAFCVVTAVRAKDVSPRRALVSLGILGLPAGLLIASTWVHSIGRAAIWATCAVAILIAVRLQRSHNRAFLAFLCALVATACAWWAGFMPALFSWVYLTSFGAMAQITDQKSASHPAASLIDIASAYGARQMALLAVALVVIGAVLLARAIRGRREKHSTPSLADPVSLLLWTSLTVLAIFGALYIRSGTSDPRRIMVGLTFLIVAVIVIAGRSRPALALIYVVPFLQCVFLLTTINGSPLHRNLSGMGAETPPLRSPDGNLELLRMLAPSVPAGSNIAVYTLALFQPASRVYEPAALNLAAFQLGTDYHIGYFWDSPDYDATVARLRNANYQFLLLDSFPDATATHMPYVKFTMELLRSVQSGQANPPGLHRMNQFSLGGRQHTLFRILPSAPVFSGQDMILNARAFASEAQKGFPVANLNDGTDAAWGSMEGQSDVYAAIVLPEPRIIHRVRIKVFCPTGRQHLRDFRIVTANEENPTPSQWQVVPARLAGQRSFSQVLTVPPALPDMSEVVVELDPRATHDPHTTWGIACFRSQGDVPNYLPVGTGFYVREITVD